VKRNNLDVLYYILALILAAALRFIQLGVTPLTNLEASQALQSLHFFNSPSVLVTAAPISTGLTAILFSIFGSSNLAARLLPALTGVLFVLVPLFFRERLGRLTTILLMFFIAFDPFLIFLSREAGGGMVAIAVVICFFAAIEKRNSVWMGILGASAILSGPFIFTGLAAIGGATAWMRGRIFDPSDDREINDHNAIQWRKVIFGAASTLLTIGLVIAKYPWLINGFGAGILTAARGWLPSADMQSQGMFTRLLLVLLVMMPLTFMLGSVGVIRGLTQKGRLSGFLARWILIAALLIFIYPQHRVTDLAWVSLPLCVAGAVEIQKWVHRPEAYPLVSYIYAAACSLLLIFCSLKIANLLVYEPGSADFQLAVAGIALTALMLAVSAFLIGWGWSWKVSFFGLGIGTVVVLLVFGASMSRRAAGLGGAQSANILAPEPIPAEAGLLIRTIDDISRQKQGVPGALGVTSLNVEDASLQWVLRDYRDARFVTALAPNETPDLLITTASENPQLPASYRGQDFTRNESVPWTLLTGKEWLNWIIYGNTPIQQDFLILWVRNDLFPDGGTGTNE